MSELQQRLEELESGWLMWCFDMLHDFHRSPEVKNMGRSKWRVTSVLEMAGATQSWDTSLSTRGNIPESSYSLQGS